MFAKKEKSRFTDRAELKAIVRSIEDMRAKRDKLKSVADNSEIGSIDYKKYAILDDILIQLDNLIDNYNKNNQPGRSREEDLTEINILLIDFTLVIGRLNQRELDIICAQRDNNKRYWNYLLHYGSMGAGATIGTVVGGPLLGLGLLISSGVGSNAARSKTGLNDITAESGLILIGLLKNIHEVFKGTLEYLGDRCDFQPMTFEETRWLNDAELSEGKINVNTIYLHADQSSIECLYKDKNGDIKKHLLDDFLDKNNLLQLQERKELGFVHKVAILSAIYKSIYAPKPIDINQNKL